MRLLTSTVRPLPTDLPLDRAEVMRYLAYKPGVTRLQERHEALVDEGIALTLAEAVPAGVLSYCAVTVSDDLVSTRVPGLSWRSRSLGKLLKGAGAVTLVGATLGPGIEDLVQRLFKVENEYALATIVDAAGSALIHSLGAYLRASLPLAGEGNGTLTPLYGPGYGDWPIMDQIALTAAAGGDVIGLTCSPTCYLVPQKSLVGVIGWVPSRARAGLTGCALCSLPDCAYRAMPARG